MAEGDCLFCWTTQHQLLSVAFSYEGLIIFDVFVLALVLIEKEICSYCILERVIKYCYFGIFVDRLYPLSGFLINKYECIIRVAVLKTILQ